MQSFVKELQNNIERHRLFGPGDRVVVGVSGGGDSIALLHGLVHLGRLEGWRLFLHVAHLHHGIRGAEADADEQFVRDTAASLHLPCTVERIDVPAEARRSGLSLEEAARFCRYLFFERVCRQINASVVAVGHNADDNAETVVQRLFRGTALRGLAGMRPRRPLSPSSNIYLARPMLNLRREAIRAFLTKQGIACREDSTNDAAKATRNRIRRELMPLIESIINPQAVDAIQRLAEHAAALHDHLEETAQRMLASLIVHEGDGEVVLDAAALTKKRWIVQTEVIRQAVHMLTPHEQSLSFRHLSAVAELAADTASGKSLDLPGGIRASKSYNKLVLARSHAGAAVESVELPLTVPGQTVLVPYGLELEATVETLEGPASEAIQTRKPPNEEWLDWDVIAPPLVVRGRRPGDRFWPLGMSADKRLAEFLLDHKVPKEERDRVAVLCDQKGPLWVIPLRIDQRARLTERTRRVLRLRCRRR